MPQKINIKSVLKKGAWLLSGLAAIFVVWEAVRFYGFIYRPNVQKDYILYVRKGTTLQEVYDTLGMNAVLKKMKAFYWVATIKKCPESLKPGRYHFEKGMNTNAIVNILRAGLQEPVRLTFNNIRTKEELASHVSSYIDADSLSILALFNPESTREYGFTPETFMAMFIPNTYEFYWTTTATQFADRMKQEFERFWNTDRLSKARSIGLTPVQVATLASIVQEETNIPAEKSKVAGVYINRLNRGMPLQADPTVKFAMGDMTLRRILNKHLDTDSPYNTYRYPGLPPGPITFPEISSIDAVLNFEKHNYLYFCARPDLSGYNMYARTNAEHERNAARYHTAMKALKN